MNIHQKVTLMNQKKKENKTNARELTEDESKKLDYEEKFKDSLSDDQTDMIQKYLEKLAPLGGWAEHKVYEFLRKYDWNEKVTEQIVGGMLKSAEEFGDSQGWTQIKKTEKPVVQKNERENKEGQKKKWNNKQEDYRKNDRRREDRNYERRDERRDEEAQVSGQPGEEENRQEGGYKQNRRYQNQNQERRYHREGRFNNRNQEQEGGEYEDRQYNQQGNYQQGGRRFYDRKQSYGKKGYNNSNQVNYVRKQAASEEVNKEESPVVTEQVQTHEEQPKVVHQEEQRKQHHAEGNGVHASAQKHQQQHQQQHQQHHETPKKQSQPEHTAHIHKSPHHEISHTQPKFQTPEKSIETVKPQEPVQSSATKHEQHHQNQQHNLQQQPHHQQQQQQQQQNPTNQQKPPVMMPLMMPPMMNQGFPPLIQVKDVPQLFPFPYIVYPQPNGISLVQPIYQMIPPQQMRPFQQGQEEQTKPSADNSQPNISQFFNLPNPEETKKTQPQTQTQPQNPFQFPGAFPTMPMFMPFGGFPTGQPQTKPNEVPSNIHQSPFHKQ